MTDAEHIGRVRVAAGMLGLAVVLMAVAFFVPSVSLLALASYMLGALGLMVLAWAAPGSRWVQNRP